MAADENELGEDQLEVLGRDRYGAVALVGDDDVLGARSVVGIDSSSQYVREAGASCADCPSARFLVGTVDATNGVVHVVDKVFLIALN